MRTRPTAKTKARVLHHKHIGEDIGRIVVSIAFAIILVKSGIVHDIVISLNGLSYLGIFIAGMFFTSVFTTAPAIVMLGGFATTHPVYMVALLGGLGAVIGDAFIYFLVKDRMAEEIMSLFKQKRLDRFTAIFKKRMFRFLIPFVGGLIIASPLPDELGAALLGASKVDGKMFLAISYIFNTLGILAIGLIAIKMAI